MASVLIALGGNVGDVRATFAKAIAHICGMAQAAMIARSSDYTTPPWGDEDQDPFINACVEIETDLDPHALLFVMQKVEQKFGRTRDKDRRWGPRTLDLDMIAYDNVSFRKPDLTLPRTDDVESLRDAPFHRTENRILGERATPAGGAEERSLQVLDHPDDRDGLG